MRFDVASLLQSGLLAYWWSAGGHGAHQGVRALLNLHCVCTGSARSSSLIALTHLGDSSWKGVHTPKSHSSCSHATPRSPVV